MYEVKPAAYARFLNRLKNFRRLRHLWPDGILGAARWVFLEPVLDLLSPRWCNPVRNGYLIRYFRATLFGGLHRRALADLFPRRPTVQGYTMRAPRDMTDGRFEPFITMLMRKLLPGHVTFVDCGAHVGYYTALASALGRDVIAIEPDPDNAQILLRNLLDNGWVNARVEMAALGETPGIMHLRNSGIYASLVDGWAGTTKRSLLVPQRRLDDIVPTSCSNGLHLLIKLDVEGSELAAVSGSERLLAQEPAPCWLVEVIPGGLSPYVDKGEWETLLKKFLSAGYRAWGLVNWPKYRLLEVTAAELGTSRYSSDLRDVYMFLFSRNAACVAALPPEFM